MEEEDRLDSHRARSGDGRRDRERPIHHLTESRWMDTLLEEVRLKVGLKDELQPAGHY
jgi:hypothetical protein